MKIFYVFIFALAACSLKKNASSKTSDASEQIITCGQLNESDCKAQSECYVIQGLNISTESVAYMGCAANSESSPLMCDTAITCFTEIGTDKRFIRGNGCFPDGYKPSACTNEEQSVLEKYYENQGKSF
jgi:hypothetical protein